MRFVDYLERIQNLGDPHDIIRCKPLDDLLSLRTDYKKEIKTFRRKRKPLRQNSRHPIRKKLRRRTVSYRESSIVRSGTQRSLGRPRSSHKHIDFTKIVLMIQLLGDVVDLTANEIVDLTNHDVIDLTHNEIVDLTNDDVVDLTENKKRKRKKKTVTHIEYEDMISRALDMPLHNPLVDDITVMTTTDYPLHKIIIDENKQIVSYSLKHPTLTKLLLNVVLLSSEDIVENLKQMRKKLSLNVQDDYYAGNNANNVNVMNCNLAIKDNIYGKINREISCYPHKVILLLRDHFNKNNPGLEIHADDDFTIILKLYHHLNVDTEDKFLHMLPSRHQKKLLEFFAPGTYIDPDGDSETKKYHIQSIWYSYKILRQYEDRPEYRYGLVKYGTTPDFNYLEIKGNVNKSVGNKHNYLFYVVQSMMNNPKLDIITILFAYKDHATVFYINKIDKQTIYYNPHGPYREHNIDSYIHIHLINLTKPFSHIENFFQAHQSDLPKCSMYCVYFCIKMLDPNMTNTEKITYFNNLGNTFDIMKFETSIMNKRIVSYNEFR
jgi:hypothetical protein